MLASANRWSSVPPPVRLVLMALACCLAWVGPAQAGTIQMRSQVTTTLTGDSLEVAVTVENAGDEAAHQLMVTAQAQDEKAEAPGPTQLLPKQPQTVRLSLAMREQRPGTYPLVVRVRFHDANGYPFTSMAYGLYHVRAPEISQVLVRATPVVIPGKGQVEFEVVNLNDIPKRVNFTAHGPQELTLDKPSQDFDLAGRGKRAILVPVENFTALAGASYPIIGLAQYQADDKHHAGLAIATVTVGAPPDMLTRLRPYLYAAGALLLALLVFMQFRRRRPQTPEA